jgi:hypothetical protein
LIDSHERCAGQKVVVLRWSIGDRVKIPAAENVCGRVYSVTVSRDGIEYSVKWFNDQGTRFFDWFLASELVSE